MAYAFTYEVPIGPDVYARIKEGLGSEPPKGLITHLAYRTDAGLRYIDVWESKADHEAFVEERLHPVVGRVLFEELGFFPPEPPMEMLDVIDAWIGN
jgi:hypothetical protein